MKRLLVRPLFLVAVLLGSVFGVTALVAEPGSAAIAKFVENGSCKGTIVVFPYHSQFTPTTNKCLRVRVCVYYHITGPTPWVACTTKDWPASYKAITQTAPKAQCFTEFAAWNFSNVLKRWRMFPNGNVYAY